MRLQEGENSMDLHALKPLPRAAIDPARIREDFPILERQVHGRRLVYLDNAATTQKPIEVIEALSRYYRSTNANIHRGLHTLSQEATEAFEASRERVARFIGGVDQSDEPDSRIQ